MASHDTVSQATGSPRARKRPTVLIVVVSVLIVIAVLVAFVPLVLNLSGSGIKTDGIDREATREATTEIDGEWRVTNRPSANSTSAGFTFDEVLPGERKTTSGSTQGVSGTVTIAEGTLTAGEIAVDLTNLRTDSDVRDNNVRRKILHTDQYPEATFVLTEPVDVSGVPDDGSVVPVNVTGELTIMETTKSISPQLEVARSGSNLIVGGDIDFNRLDYGVETPELVAATIAEEGQINLRLNLAKD